MRSLLRASLLRATLGLTLLFWLGVAAQAQTAPVTAPVPAPSLFTMSGNYGSFRSASSMTPVVIASVAVQATKRFSVGYEHISNASTDARWELGVGAYTRQACDILGSKLSKALLFDSCQIGVTFVAGGGKLLQPTVNRVAETAGIHFSYPLADHISLKIFGVDVLHGGVKTGFVTTNTTANLSSGLNIYF